MGGRDPVVMQAIANVVNRVPVDDWWAMPSHQRTQAIYDEIRRLDKEALRRHVTVAERPVEELADSVV